MILRIAICGPSGAGKTTLAGMLADAFALADAQSFQLRIATPLYAVQDLIYQISAQSKSADFQDTLLLTFLGQYIRKINPSALIDIFSAELARCIMTITKDQTTVIICSDARVPDIPQLRRLHFRLIYIDAAPPLLMARIDRRGDANAHQTSPQLEIRSETADWDFSVRNEGTVDQLKREAIRISSILLGTQR